MAAMGTTQRDSIRMPAENPARICVPKPFTTDWTSIIPIETVDCWRMDGNAMRDMEENSALLNQVSAFPSNRRSVCRKIRKEQTAEMPWAIKVA